MNKDEFESSDDDSSILEDHDENLKNKILQVFKVFDQNKDNTIDINDVGNVYRCLQINITEEQLNEIQSQLLKTDSDNVHFEHLMPRLLSQLQNLHNIPANNEALEAAFRTFIDVINQDESNISASLGLTKDKFEKLMMTRGEPLTETEMSEMRSHLSIRKNGIVDWRSYIRDIKLTFQEMTNSLKQKNNES